MITRISFRFVKDLGLCYHSRTKLRGLTGRTPFMM